MKLGVVFCCEKAKLPSAGALICRQLQMSVGPRSAQPINNGICALTQTDFPQTVREGETESERTGARASGGKGRGAGRGRDEESLWKTGRGGKGGKKKNKFGEATLMGEAGQGEGA